MKPHTIGWTPAQAQRAWRIIALGVGLAAAAGAGPAWAQTALPVYALAPPTADEGKLLQLARAIAPKAEIKQDPSARPGTVAYRAGDLVADIELRSGSMFVADMAWLWNGLARPQVPAVDAARSIADRFVAEHKLMPAAGKFARFGFVGASEAGSGEDVPGAIDRLVISRHFTYAPRIVARDASGNELALPVVGGGGELRVSVGDAGRVVGYAGGWRAIEGAIDMVPISSREEVLSSFAKQLEARKLKATALDARLAYYAAPSFKQQKVLAPVWVLDGSLLIGTEIVPMRTQILAATQYGPTFNHGKPARVREPNQLPPPPDGDEAPVKTTFLDWFVPRAHAAGGLECGTSWIGVSGGLWGSAGNRQGFLDRCSDAGWNLNFDWGDQWAFESDWNSDDDNWVDAADLVFYTGHAGADSWTLSKPNDGSLHYSEIAGGSDRYGAQDLEWFIIAACGPFESSHFVGQVGNAFDRWRPLFDGLHVALGYGAVTLDNEEEGDRFMELSQAGWNVIDAWFRTAQEIQNATNTKKAPYGPAIWVVAMYAHNGDYCARNDHLHGEGSVCNDVPAGSGQSRTMVWSGT